MSTRRGFLRALGMGGICMGLPGIAHGFGRRRRCVPADCGAPSSPAPSSGSYRMYDVPMCTTACPLQYYGASNGVYYYYCLCCGDGNMNVSCDHFIDTPYPTCDNSAGCISVVKATDPNPGFGRTFDADFPRHLFCDANHVDGVWAINDKSNPNPTPADFPVMPGVTQETTAPDNVKYDIDPPHGIFLYARVHEITRANTHILRIGHPYDPTKPLPDAPTKYTFVRGAEKHDVIEAPETHKRYHIHRRK
jgi:hypothetical protein